MQHPPSASTPTHALQGGRPAGDGNGEGVHNKIILGAASRTS